MESLIVAPTSEEMVEEIGLKSVLREADDSWRHGSYIYQVFFRESDNTYWAENYRLSSDGETNELREGLADISQVEPHEVVKVEYRAIGAKE